MTAVFLTVDPIVSSTKQPYGYALQDPINAVDRSGLCAAQAAPPRRCGGVIETPWGSIVTKVRHESNGWSLRWQINLNAEIRAQLNGSWIRAEAITTVNNRYINNFGSHSPEPPYYHFHSRIYKVDFKGPGPTRYLHRGDVVAVLGEVIPIDQAVTRISYIQFSFECKM